ncbi:MAG TPA: hypothetical protein VMV29_08160 [Ktedonobacterales bacterium]|nr:hypothetical protein [Ktedonobacterales bacterium]
MTKSKAACEVMSDARTTHHSNWLIRLIVVPLLTMNLAVSALFGMVVAPQVAGFIGHVAPTSHAVVVVTPNNLGGPDLP